MAVSEPGPGAAEAADRLGLQAAWDVWTSPEGPPSTGQLRLQQDWAVMAGIDRDTVFDLARRVARTARDAAAKLHAVLAQPSTTDLLHEALSGVPDRADAMTRTRRTRGRAARAARSRRNHLRNRVLPRQTQAAAVDQHIEHVLWLHRVNEQWFGDGLTPFIPRSQLDKEMHFDGDEPWDDVETRGIVRWFRYANTPGFSWRRVPGGNLKVVDVEYDNPKRWGQDVSLVPAAGAPADLHRFAGNPVADIHDAAHALLRRVEQLVEGPPTDLLDMNRAGQLR